MSSKTRKTGKTRSIAAAIVGVLTVCTFAFVGVSPANAASYSPEGTCGTSVYAGSVKFDDDSSATNDALVYFGTVRNWKLPCKRANGTTETCWYADGKRVDNGAITIGMKWMGNDMLWHTTTASGSAWVKSPKVCDHAIDGYSRYGIAKINSTTSLLLLQYT